MTEGDLYIREGIPAYYHLWAKTGKDENASSLHPLLYHMLEVGECALALWNFSLCEQTRKSFSSWLGLEQAEAGNLLAFWAALHDLGKAAPGFQAKYPACLPRLKMQGFVFPVPAVVLAPHGILTTWALKDLLQVETGLSVRVARHIAFALGGHHGVWPTNDLVQSPALKSSDKGSGLWDVARKDLFMALKSVYQPVYSVHLPTEDEQQLELNTFITLFSGFVSIADWIGSMVEFFPPVEKYQNPIEYAGHAGRQARLALEKLGWINWQADGSLLSFAAMFPEMPVPRTVQAEVIDLATNAPLPALVILEAPTGIGKTEAALYLADTWVQRFRGKGIYFAMPTQATSNQMYGRVVKFLQKRYPGQLLNTHLVHGAALLEELEETPQLNGINEHDGGVASLSSVEGTVRAESWFLPRKRTLLAPFGVGTVDQALLSVLQTKHFFVRMFGLAHKVVVFDEIHAYDTYMSTLFQRLLRWLHSIGTSVILLSATLPEKTRRELVSAWLGRDALQTCTNAYPRLTVAGAGQVDVFNLTAPDSHRLNVDWIESSPEEIASDLEQKLKDGGCAAVICNRVRRAQDVYTAIRAANIVGADELILFHARYPFQWRQEIEDKVLKIFSKSEEHPGQPNPNRLHRAIVVATQVIEQSLDLDFDYMISDLAPVDLLIQRAGRLHRHKQNQAVRPNMLALPVMAICKPDEQGDLPDFGLDGKIYDLSILLRTWKLLSEKTEITLPDHVSDLIEVVYGGKLENSEYISDYLNILERAKEQERLIHEKEVYQAKQRLIAVPQNEDLLTNHNEGLDEDNPKLNEAFRALTRLSEPSVNLLCFHDTAWGVALEPNGQGAPIYENKYISLQLAKKMLRCAVSIQRRDVVNYFANHFQPTIEWRKSVAIRHHVPVIFNKDGEFWPEDANFILKLTRELGLEIIKKEKV